MNNIINKLSLCVAVALTFVGCYNNYEDPAVAYTYTSSDFEDSESISIYQLKSDYNSLVGTDGNSVIEEDLVISGKVISSDEEGSVYKSLFILDHSSDIPAAIELRLFASNYVNYPVGSMIYVKLQGLSIGDYGGMLSIGAHSYAPDVDEDYVHTTIENTLMLKEHIFLGEKTEMESRDTVVVTGINASTYEFITASGESVSAVNLRARLVRFEGVESCWGASGWGYQNTFPNYFSSSSEMFDWEDFDFTGTSLESPTLAYYGASPNTTSSTLVRYYGSSWYSYNRSSSVNENHIVARVSGYARFREDIIPEDGAMVNVTAIYTQYKTSDYRAYQLQINHGTDLETL